MDVVFELAFRGRGGSDAGDEVTGTETGTVSISIDSPGPGQTVVETITVSGSFVATAGVDSIFVSVDGTAFAAAAISGLSWSYVLDTSLYPEGLASIVVKIQDVLGNTATASVSVSFGSGGVVGGGTIPGPTGTLRMSFDASLQSVGPGQLGDPSDIGPVDPWEARADTVGLNSTYNPNEDTTYGTWSIVSTPIGDALQGYLPVGTTLKRRCDLSNGKNSAGTGITSYPYGNAWNFLLGEEVWFCMEFQAPTTFPDLYNNMNVTDSPFFLINQTAPFPITYQPSFSMHARPTYCDVVIETGAFASTPSSQTYEHTYRANLIPVERWALAPAWHQVVIRWVPQFTATGVYQGWHRKRGETAWSPTMNFTNIVTLDWWASGGQSSRGLTARDEVATYSRGGTVAGTFLYHKYARASGPGVLEQFLNS